MKALSVIMVMGGLASLVPAMAQDAEMPRLRARAVNKAIKKGKPANIYVTGANGGRVMFAESKDSQLIQELPQNSFKTLYFFDTEDFLNAQHAMENRKYEGALKRAGRLTEKYKALMGIKGSPAARAAVMELQCAMHLLDLEKVKELVAAFPVKASNLPKSEQLDLEVAKILALVADKKWADVKTKAENFQKNNSKATFLQKARVRYALGEASMDAKQWSKAWDAFAQAIVLLHGRDEALATACVKRSLDGYLAQPEVTEFAAGTIVAELIKNKAPMPDGVIAKCPMFVKEGAALYYIFNMIHPNVALPEQYNLFAIAFKLNPPKEAPAEPAKKAQKPKAPAAAK